MIVGIGFGRIELNLCGGEPCFDPPPGVSREWLLNAPPLPRGVGRQSDDVGLNELFRLLHEINAGPVTIEIRHGRPHRVLQSLRGAS